MRLEHMSDKTHDFETQIQELSRDTTNMLLSTLSMVGDDNELYLDVTRFAKTDWNNTTHKVCTTFIPSKKPGAPDRTLLTILVKETIKEDDTPIPSKTTLLYASVFLGHYQTEYHTRYIPLEWNLDVIETTLNNQREYYLTGGAAIAMLRCLAIQLGVPLAIENKYVNKSIIDEMHTYGMPESNEMLFLRFGLDHLMKMVRLHQ